jgi:hypothetical protein
LSEQCEKDLYKSEIICDRAHILFGLILRLLCQRANITQDEMEERGKAYRESLLLKGLIKPGYALGALDQATISRVISGDRWPSYDQVQTWVHIREEGFNSEEYKQVRKRKQLPVYEFPYDLKVDLYHLAGFGAPDEIVAAYEKRLHMATEPPPREVRTSGKSSPRRQGRYTGKSSNNDHWQAAPVNEI